MPIQSFNPYTNQLEKSYDQLTEKEVSASISQAEKAFTSWRDVPISERSELMKNLANLLRQKSSFFAEIMTKEMGKLFREGKEWEVETCSRIADYYAEHAERFLAPEKLEDIKQGEAYIEKHPTGVLFGIMPWNYPLYQVFRFVCPNIMAGNVCLVKHASNVPQCAEAIESLFREAGFPEGVYTNLFIRSKLASSVIADQRVVGVSFTGSERAGASVAEQAGRHLKKVVLELGGSDPFIVLEDADLDYSLEMAMVAKMFNTGQTCVAAKRYIVEEGLFDDFISGFKERMALLRPGNPMDLDTGYGPMSSQAEVDNLLEVIKEAVEMGAVLVQGGHSNDLPGAWLQPTILTGVTSEMRAGREELFGPVAVVYKASSAEEAIKMANDSPYGLSSSIFSQNVTRAQDLARKLEAGMTFINSLTASEPGLPFGGIKRSGFGRELSHLGIEEFLNKKLVRIAF